MEITWSGRTISLMWSEGVTDVSSTAAEEPERTKLSLDVVETADVLGESSLESAHIAIELVEMLANTTGICGW